MTHPMPQRPPPCGAPDDLICACRKVTRAQIDAAITEHGLTQAHQITACLGAGAECGACTPSLLELLGDPRAWFEAEVHRSALSADPNAPTRIERVDFVLPLGRSYPASSAGQHITVQADIGGHRITRSYTVIEPGLHPRAVSVAVRHQPNGQLTPWLLGNAADAQPRKVRISAPAGPKHWQSSMGMLDGPTVCMVGGIGITLAVSLLKQRPPQARLHVNYRARHPGDHVFTDELDAQARLNPLFTLRRCSDETEPDIGSEVQDALARFSGANFVLCGPPGYVQAIEKQLLASGIQPDRIHIEKFYVSPKTHKPSRSWKSIGYGFGALAALLPALLLMPWAQAYVPHGAWVIGHEKLACNDCHEPAPGTLRQQLQAKLDHLLGNRESAPAFVNHPVGNSACTRCHVKSDDRHPPHRFLEPRFENLRDTLAPQRCASCHREHEGRRVTVDKLGYCETCHDDLVLKTDPVQPPHSELIAAKNWDSCLGCHDFHNNHEWQEPTKLSDAIPPDRLLAYLRGSRSPYGAVREPATAKGTAQATAPSASKKPDTGNPLTP